MHLPSTRTMLKWAKTSIVVGIAVCTFANTTAHAYSELGNQTKGSQTMQYTGGSPDADDTPNIPETKIDPPEDEELAVNDFADRFDLDPSFSDEDRQLISEAIELASQDQEFVNFINEVTSENQTTIYLRKGPNNRYVPAEEIPNLSREEGQDLSGLAINGNLGFIDLDLDRENIFFLKKGGDPNNPNHWIESDIRKPEFVAETLFHEADHIKQDAEECIWSDNSIYKEDEKVVENDDISRETYLEYENSTVGSTNRFLVNIDRPDLQRGDYSASRTPEGQELAEKLYDVQQQLAELEASVEISSEPSIKHIPNKDYGKEGPSI